MIEGKNLLELILTYDHFLSPIQYKILEVLWEHEDLTRADLVKLLNTPRTTVYDNLVKLEKMGFIKNFTRDTGIKGRPKVYWALNYITLLKKLSEIKKESKIKRRLKSGQSLRN